MTSFLKKLIFGNLVCIKTCYSFKSAKPFQWAKQNPKIVILWNHLDWCLKAHWPKIAHFSRILLSPIFFWTEVIRATSNQKPTLSKQILTWEEMLQLGRPSMACIVALSRRIVKKKEKKKKRNIDCHVMHLKNLIKSKRESKRKKCWENDEKLHKPKSFFSCKELLFSLGN